MSTNDINIDFNPLDETDDFERLLNDFINQEFEKDIQNAQEELDEDFINLNETKTNDEDDIKLLDIDSNNNQSIINTTLNEKEFSLYRAYNNFIYSINSILEINNHPIINTHLKENMLYPRYKKRAGNAISKDILKGWDIILQLMPNELKNIKPSCSDDELLDFAEQCSNDNLQLAVISYVETMIELEGCEIDYRERKLKYERYILEKEIYEEHQRRADRAKKYIEAIKEKKFPIDADRLVNNYFRLSNKDPVGSFNALTTNPATFAPIDFSKLKDRFFGFIKVKPQDGIRINQKIGEFLKKLKV